MNPVLREAAATATGGWVLGAMTVLFLAFFLGWAWWAYSSHNRDKMNEAALLPLATGDDA